MWVCPKCGREFKRTNQGHYCGKPPESVEEYIKSQPAAAQAHLTKLREIIYGSVPDIQERIAWSMPMYEKSDCSVSFAACKSHISFYADMEALNQYKPQLSGYIIKKNALYLPYDKALPEQVIENIVIRCFSSVGRKADG